ncbi:ABC transporter permease subunit [Methylobacterium nigriterrae]|uniref:ABC transporter permease subunit n=1 Tax=Methylobacterium nigriterrae TaxID=3127512 RepID=UPI003013CAC5
MPSPDLISRRHAPLTPLLAKELRDLLAGRALWAVMLLLCPIMGYGFVQATALYSEASRSAASFPELARGLSPLDGVLVPTFGAFYVAVTLLFPFVAIRALGAEKQNGGLKLLLQLPYRSATLIVTKLVAVLAGWLLAAMPALSALALWSLLGGHLWPAETLNLLLGHLLYGLLIACIGLFAAAVTESPATAAILALAFTLGAWILDFAAAGQGAWLRRLAELSPTAALRGFETGLLSGPAVLGILTASATFGALACTWLRPAPPDRRRMALSAGIMVGTLAVGALVGQARYYLDTAEDRRNSFSPVDEAALRQVTKPLAVTIYLSPEDPRFADFNRQVLSKLRRLMPGLSATLAETSKSFFSQADDDRYGLIRYEYGSAQAESRSTSPREVLPLIYELTGVTASPSVGTNYVGYPIVVDGHMAALWFYGVLPTIVVFGWWLSRRPIRLRRLRATGDSS